MVLKPVMALHPNRKSLLFGAAVLAPQSGGMQDQVDLLGTRHARMSLYIPVYDAATCAIDAAFFTPYAEGPRLYAARPPLNPAQSPARLVRCSPSSTNLTPP